MDPVASLSSCVFCGFSFACCFLSGVHRISFESALMLIVLLLNWILFEFTLKLA